VGSELIHSGSVPTRPMRIIIAVLLTGFAAGPAVAAVEPAKINFEFVRQLALARAASPYHPAAAELPERFAKLTYDEYHLIQFRKDDALWRGLPFQAQFFPRGGLYQDAVTLHEFSATHEQTIPFDPAWFQVGDHLPPLPASLGFAGFRILYPVNQP